MSEQEMNNRLNDRAKELLAIPQMTEKYLSFGDEKAAKDWILNQALITLLYSHEERIEMAEQIQ